jgi:translation initiation factor IF-3
LIGPDGKQMGVVTIRDAIRMAQEEGLDLVEVSPNAKPPVCRITDFGKLKYEQSKKAQAAKKKQTIIQIKEIKLRPRTDVHDLEVKKKRIREFLAEGNKVKVTVRFRGREIVYKDLGLDVLNRIQDEFSEIAVVESQPSIQGPMLHMIFAPKKG